MSYEQFAQIVTLLGAVLAGVTGVINLLLQAKGKSDFFVVRLGAVRPEAMPEAMMHVVSLSDHPIEITDYGFIESDGRLTSIIFGITELDIPAEEARFNGKSLLKARGDYLEVGYERKSPMGAYALTVTEKRPQIAFSQEASWFFKIKTRLRLAWLGDQYLA